MEASTFECRKCTSKLPVESINSHRMIPCPSCGNRSLLHVFPILFKPMERPQAPERVVLDSESSCFYHVDKKAVIPCDHCGRFLCSLCDIAIGDRHLCPACMEKGADSVAELPTANEYTYYDNVALLLAFFPIVTVIFWFASLVTAPLALFVVVRYWKKPLSTMPRRRWRYVLAALVALAQMAAWGYGLILLTMNIAAAVPM